ncbi:AraC family transcriptional regulator [Butyrivibrio sp. YAB3001]|uniref:AraC family transcriptional regulator n=1 Tax=Butyrivibrio sp. YAB3001 TaxID=1520812 RepID=UPI0008F68FEF|nr:AraC family transcriptional regulator [Butyrivibrio sp. YAB3001]SFB71896.1 AraC-type DNA-binding protein [Butyrivibrio sp. YAB3001]
MNKRLLDILGEITDEEKAILNGEDHINRDLYYSKKDTSGSSDSSPDNEIDSSRVLPNGKLIDIRPHVRFIHFPLHTHNYVEFIYMCQGETIHIIDGQRITLKQGDLLFLNQHAKQEILPAGENDIAVNFMILPSFFSTAFSMLEHSDSPLKDFLVSCLTQKDIAGNYLYFNVSNVPQIQNIMENLIWNMIMDNASKTDRIISDFNEKTTINQVTMGLLFLTLLQHTDTIKVSRRSYDQELMFKLLRYIEDEYSDASLSHFSEMVKEDEYVLSRIIKKNTGNTFKELLQNKRLSKACELLKNTDISIADISVLVGYDNTSFFHRLFRRIHGCSPREYRINL